MVLHNGIVARNAEVKYNRRSAVRLRWDLLRGDAASADRPHRLYGLSVGPVYWRDERTAFTGEEEGEVGVAPQHTELIVDEDS